MMRAGAFGLLAAGALALVACAPVPVHQAEEQCARLVMPKPPLSGEAGMGVTNNGFRSKTRVEINLGVSSGEDPSAAFDRCVYDRSGQMPTRPLYARTDWKG